MSGPRLLALLIGCLVSGSVIAGEPDADRGKRLYKVCAGCHGFSGEGNEIVGAPSLAGQETWYLARQIGNYQHGIRGGNGDDALGVSMAMMAQALTSEEHSADVVAYINTLPRPTPAAGAGDPARGASLYAPCVACHGEQGQGNEALQAPALNLMPAWYQIAQLKKFKGGSRGRQPGDTYGAQMAPMAAVLSNEADMADVTAYILSLNE